VRDLYRDDHVIAPGTLTISSNNKKKSKKKEKIRHKQMITVAFPSPSDADRLNQ